MMAETWKRILWQKDTDWKWHAGYAHENISTAFCGQIEPSRSGHFNEPRVMRGYEDLCKTCDNKVTEITNE